MAHNIMSLAESILMAAVLFLCLLSISEAKACCGDDAGSSGDKLDTYTISIQMDYNWNINETINTYTITHESIWNNIKDLFQQPEFDVEHIEDETSNKQDLIYTLSKAQMLFENNLTETWSMEIEVDVLQQSETLINYVQSKENASLASDIRQKYKQNDGLLNIVTVTCSVEEQLSSDQIIAIIFCSLMGACCLCGCIVYITCKYKNCKPQPPEQYINDPNSIKNIDYNPFIDGWYYGSYDYSGKTRILKDFELKFKDTDVTGNGEDEIGHYNITGIYSLKTQRMALHKQYTSARCDADEIRIEYVLGSHYFRGSLYDSVKRCGEFSIKHRSEHLDIKEIQKEDNKDYHAVDRMEPSDSDSIVYNNKICSPELFVNDSKYIKHHNDEGNNPFADGTYSGYYKDSNKDYDINEFLMTFKDDIVTGYGSDIIGDYNIEGIYSDKTQRMAFDQIYINSPDDSLMMRLEYDGNEQKFRGKWFGKKDKYEADGQSIVMEKKNIESESEAQKCKSIVSNMDNDITYC